MFHETDYRAILQEKFSERASSNPSYSLRAMARDLAISPSRLSQILQGKQGISEKIALQFAQRLRFTKNETEFFCSLVESTDARSKVQRKLAQVKLAQKYYSESSARTLELDVFRTISDWYHFALLELTTVKGFKNDHAWIAKRLGISKDEARSAIERLKRLELLKERGKSLVQTFNSLQTPSDIPSDALKKFYRQVLGLATQSIDSQSVNERELTSLTVAVRNKDLPKFKKQINSFRNAFNESAEAAEKSVKPDEVYCLNIQFFRLTQKEHV